MARRVIAVLLATGLVAGLAAWPAGAAKKRSFTQTLVFNAIADGSFVDKPPTGPSPGDIELTKAKLVDSHGRVVGTARSACVFTKQTADDMLERCSDSAKTREGRVTLTGVGHLNSMNPPWKVTGKSGAYKGVHGTLVFSTDIPLDPGVPIAPGRGFSVGVIEARVTRPLKIGVVPRPAANSRFIRRANALCGAAQTKVQQMGPFPFDNFDPFHPDPQVLPKVGQFFSQPARQGIPSALLEHLQHLGKPPASRGAWKNVLKARRTLMANEASQVKAALANDVPAFTKTVYEQSRDYNQLVFASAVFGVQNCTFG